MSADVVNRYPAGVVVRSLTRRLRIRSTMFFSTGLSSNGRSVVLPALEDALAFAKAKRERGRRVWIERAGAPAHVGPVVGLREHAPIVEDARSDRGELDVAPAPTVARDAVVDDLVNELRAVEQLITNDTDDLGFHLKLVPMRIERVRAIRALLARIDGARHQRRPA